MRISMSEIDVEVNFHRYHRGRPVLLYVWQSWIKIEYHSSMHFKHITKFDTL